MVTTKDIIKAAVAKKKKSLQLKECFDPNFPESRPNDAQVKFFQDADKVKYRYLIAGNGAGKSQTGARELAWILQDSHPYWKMPEDWKNRALQILVIGKSRSILEDELWGKKIKPYLNPTDWKERRPGSSLASVEHKTLGHKIIFLTHSDGSQRAIDNLQAYDADVVWLDEMPAKLAVLEETQRRTRRPNTLWFATFTPKSVNIKIRKVVDSAVAPIAKRYRMSRLDVPGVDIEAELAALEGYSEAHKRTVLEGDWAVGDEHVYQFDADSMLVSLPEDYSKTSWRHVECVDPGSNRGGLTVWAEHPKTKVWYCVYAEYIDGLRDPVAFYDKCQEVTSQYNIVRRICDPAGTSHIGHSVARDCSPPYIVPYAKNQGRKKDLIKEFQSKLSQGRLKLVEERCVDFTDELSEARYNEGKTRIINAHKFHLADCGQYFTDLIPEPVDTPAQMTRDEWILSQDDKRRTAEAKEYEKQNKKLEKKQVYRILKKIQGGRRWSR